jgi:hypothetical protein
MKLITELSESVTYITESIGTNDKKQYFIEGCFLQAETPNRNGRNYPKHVMEREVKNFQTLIKENRSTGELGHPDTLNVMPENISHLITELKFDGNNVIGKAKILESMPKGYIAKCLLDEGVKIGVSSRGVGSLSQRKDGINEVQDDFYLRTIDIVSEPSGIDCWVNGIMEGVEWVNVNGIFTQKQLDESKRIIKKTSSSDLQKVCLEQFQHFLNSIK